MIGPAVERSRELAPTARTDALRLLRAETAAWNALLATFTPDDWSAPTVCDRWSVRDIVGHLDGHAEEILRPWLFPFRDRTGARRHPELARLDAHMEAQVDVHRRRSVDDLRRRFARDWDRAVRRLARLPEFVRARGIATGIEAMPHLTLGTLADVIYLRDLWMHRDDICRATGRAAAPQPHDAEVVAQVLRDARPRLLVRSGCRAGADR